MEELFNIAWKTYPKRRGSKGAKALSKRLFIKAVDIHGWSKVISAIENYKTECVRSGKINTEYVKQFPSWINCGRGRIKEKGRFLGVEQYQEIKNPECSSPKWVNVRYFALKNSNGRCCLCGLSAKDGVILHVDHIKPKSLYPELEFELSNLQVLCEYCNVGKSNKDDTDWR